MSKVLLIRSIFGALALALLGGGCVTARDFSDPRQRITQATAYSLTNREVRVDVGALGTELSDAGGTIGVAAGFGRGGQVSTNLAHLSLGLVNGSVKYTALDRPWFGLGFQGTFLWTRPDLIWLLPEEIQEPLAGLDLFIVPLTAIASFPLAPWTSLHLGLGYTHAEVLGQVGGGSAVFEGGVGTRTLHVEPTAHFYLGRRVALILGSYVPVYAVAIETLEADVELEEGVVAGIRSAEWVRIPTRGASRGRIGLETRFGKRTHLRVFVARGPLSTIGIGPPVLPSFNLYWRI